MLPSRNIIVIGGSTGALEAVREIVAGLRGDIPAAVFVTIHTAPDNPGLLDRILSRAGALTVSYARDGEPIREGHVFLAPPDHHLIVKRRSVRVTRGPKENRFRPAIDPMFRTASIAHGHRVIGIVVSGGQDDGAVGAGLIKRRGGTVLVQDPSEALAPSMPQAALTHVQVDHVAGAREMPSILARLLAESLKTVEDDVMDEQLPKDVAEIGSDAIHDLAGTPPSRFTCPDCGGALWEARDGDLLQYQCHVGHRFSGAALEAAHTDGVEQALWVALRALEESADLRRRMAAHARDRGMDSISRKYEDHARDSEQHADVVRRVLLPDVPDMHGAVDEPAPSGLVHKGE